MVRVFAIGHSVPIYIFASSFSISFSVWRYSSRWQFTANRLPKISERVRHDSKFSLAVGWYSPDASWHCSTSPPPKYKRDAGPESQSESGSIPSFYEAPSPSAPQQLNNIRENELEWEKWAISNSIVGLTLGWICEDIPCGRWDVLFTLFQFRKPATIEGNKAETIIND